MYKPAIHTLALLVGAALAWPGVGSAQAFKVAKYSIGGDGGTDYLTAEPGTGRVFVSRSTHVMVIDGASGKVLGDIADTPRPPLAARLASPAAIQSLEPAIFFM